MKNNTLLLIGAAVLYFYWMKKKKTTVLPPDETETFQAIQSGQIELIRSQTVNFPQLAPTPSSILDLPGSVNYQGGAYSGCNCCNQGRLSGMPVVC